MFCIGFVHELNKRYKIIEYQTQQPRFALQVNIQNNSKMADYGTVQQVDAFIQKIALGQFDIKEQMHFYNINILL